MSEPSKTLGFLFQREAWMETGACKDPAIKPEWFILERGQNARRGKEVCSRCPHTGEAGPCYEYAEMTGSVGLWGGHLFAIKPEHVETAVDITPITLQDARPVRLVPTICTARHPLVQREHARIAARRMAS